MLRNLVLALAVLMTAAGAALCLAGVPAFPPLIFGALLLIGTLGERAVYKRLVTPAAAGAGFRPTAERFYDDATGAPVTVWADPATGERKYVRD